ncbi:MAG: hypothetical protein J6C56_06375 [Alistipes sp.]|nr:hypothetical protein [Alistipes sp.]
MKKSAKEIAIKLGITIPASVLSISAANAAEPTMLQVPEQDIMEVCKNEVIDLISPLHSNYTSESGLMVHSDVHTNIGNNHADHHANTNHSDSHSNTNAKSSYKWVTKDDGTQERVEFCDPHSDRHTNRNPVQSHTNSGNKHHTDKHSNRDSYYECN